MKRYVKASFRSDGTFFVFGDLIQDLTDVVENTARGLGIDGGWKTFNYTITGLDDRGFEVPTDSDDAERATYTFRVVPEIFEAAGDDLNEILDDYSDEYGFYAEPFELKGAKAVAYVEG